MDEKIKTSATAVAAAGLAGAVALGSYVLFHAQKLKIELGDLIDHVMDALKDGKWHSVRAIARQLNQPEGKIIDILRFCEEYHFVALNETAGQARLAEKLMAFLE